MYYKVVNGVPDIKEIPPEKLESFLAVLEMQISKYYENQKKSRWIKVNLFKDIRAGMRWNAYICPFFFSTNTTKIVVDGICFLWYTTSTK